MGDKNEERKWRIERPRGSRPAGEVADWMQADGDLLQRCIARMGFLGGALRFGKTRDGGAYAIGVYLGDEYFTDYIKPSEDIDDYLRSLLGSLEDASPLETGSVKPNKKR